MKKGYAKHPFCCIWISATSGVASSRLLNVIYKKKVKAQTTWLYRHASCIFDSAAQRRSAKLDALDIVESPQAQDNQDLYCPQPSRARSTRRIEVEDIVHVTSNTRSSRRARRQVETEGVGQGLHVPPVLPRTIAERRSSARTIRLTGDVPT